MNIEEERELFEDWHFKEHYVKSADKSFLYERFDSNSEYILHEVQYAWKAWLASRNRGGYVLVPVDTLNRTVGHIAIALCHPNNSKNEEDVMHKDLEIIEKAMIGACDE